MSQQAQEKKKRARPAVPTFNIGSQSQDSEGLGARKGSGTSIEEEKPQAMIFQKSQAQTQEQKELQDKKKKANMFDKINSMFKKKVEEKQIIVEEKKTVVNLATKTLENSENPSQSQDGSNGNGKPILSIEKKYKKSLYTNENEEYDPSKPNDYEELKLRQQNKQRKGQKLIREEIMLKKKEMEEQLIQQQKELMEKQEREQREYEQKLYSLPDKNISKVEDQRVESGQEKALKFMKKFGYKVGEGLGKNKQGITAPIIHMKVGDNLGVMTQGQGDMSSILSQDIRLKNYIEQIQLDPSRVLVLLNTVGPGEIDDELEEEIVEECENYGKVLKSIVYLMPQVPEDQAVRIFIMFENTNDAIMAFGDMHGRSFGSRIVQALFYPEKYFIENQFNQDIKMPAQLDEQNQIEEEN